MVFVYFWVSNLSFTYHNGLPCEGPLTVMYKLTMHFESTEQNKMASSYVRILDALLLGGAAAPESIEAVAGPLKHLSGGGTGGGGRDRRLRLLLLLLLILDKAAHRSARLAGGRGMGRQRFAVEPGISGRTARFPGWRDGSVRFLVEGGEIVLEIVFMLRKILRIWIRYVIALACTIREIFAFFLT